MKIVITLILSCFINLFSFGNTTQARMTVCKNSNYLKDYAPDVSRVCNQAKKIAYMYTRMQKITSPLDTWHIEYKVQQADLDSNSLRKEVYEISFGNLSAIIDDSNCSLYKVAILDQLRALFNGDKTQDLFIYLIRFYRDAENKILQIEGLLQGKYNVAFTYHFLDGRWNLERSVFFFR